MTCALCGYEFCWACGGSASAADGHFQGRGCGVAQMDETVKAGNYEAVKLEEKATTCTYFKDICKALGIALLCIILFPFFLVFYVPVTMYK